MLPAAALIPGGMGFERSGGVSRGSLGSARGRGRRGGEVAERGDIGTLQADERIGAHHQFPPARDGVVLGHPLVGPAQVILRMLKPVCNGLVTNDKFCLSRSARLHLSHWHLPWRRRLGAVAQEVYPAHQRVGVGGDTNEAPPTAGPPPVSGNPRRPAAMGSGLTAPRPVEP